MSSITLYEGSVPSAPNSGLIIIYAKTDGTLAYKNDLNEEVVVGEGGGGSGFPQLTPNTFSLDDTNTGSSRGSAFGMIDTIDFASGEDGSVWATFHFPSTLDAGADINLDLIYNLSGSNDSTTVTIETQYWVYGDGTTPSSSTPDGTNSDNISTGTGEDGSRRSSSLTNIPSADLTAGNTVTLKITRLGSSDSYTGTFQMIYIFPYQS